MNSEGDGNDPKVVPLTRAKMPLEGPPAEVDARLVEMLNRRLDREEAERARAREIELSSEDLKALQSEQQFKARFGFALGRRGRQSLFEVIDRYDLTDAEVRALDRVGCFDWDGHTLRVRARRWIGFAGIAYLTVITLLAVLAGAAIASLGKAAWQPRAILWSILVALLLIGMMVYRLYLMPFQLFGSRRIGGK